MKMNRFAGRLGGIKKNGNFWEGIKLDAKM